MIEAKVRCNPAHSLGHHITGSYESSETRAEDLLSTRMEKIHTLVILAYTGKVYILYSLCCRIRQSLHKSDNSHGACFLTAFDQLVSA